MWPTIRLGIIINILLVEMRKITFIFFNFTRNTTSAPLSLTYLKALTELFIGAVLAVVDSVTEV